MLGAGGTGRAAVWALREAGADVAVWNRTPERAAELAAELGVRHATAPEPAPTCSSTSTSLGMHGEDLPAELGLDGVEPELVADVVYGSEPTALCRWGEAAGRAGGRRARDAAAPGRAELRALDRPGGPARRDARALAVS